MKKALSLALAAAMAASLAACGGSSAASTASSAATTDTAASGAASAGGQTLKVMLSEEPGEGDAFATTLTSGPTRPATPLTSWLSPTRIS